MVHVEGKAALMNTSMPILVVDDSQTMRSVILGYLNSLEYTEVDFAEDGQIELGKNRAKAVRPCDLGLGDAANLVGSNF